MKKVCLSFFEKHTFFSALDTQVFPAFDIKQYGLKAARRAPQFSKR